MALFLICAFAFGWCIRHSDGFTFSFALMQKNKVTKRKNQGYVSGATAERSFWRWKKNSLRCTTLKQHFSAPPGHSSAHAPPPRPFYYTPRRFAVGFGGCFAWPSVFAVGFLFWLCFYVMRFAVGFGGCFCLTFGLCCCFYNLLAMMYHNYYHRKIARIYHNLCHQ